MRQLDGLRAFAVAAVAYSHWMPAKYQIPIGCGALGVNLFFVLSGFLISGILLNCRKSGQVGASLWAFYFRRILRIFPVYYASLAALYALDMPQVRSSISWHLLYGSNFYFLFHGFGGPISHFWSLAVEEQFYFFWPVVLLTVSDRFVLPAALGLCSFGVISQIVLPLLFPDALLLLLPNMNFDSLGIGALLAVTRVQKAPWLERISLAGVVLLIAVVALQACKVPTPYLAGRIGMVLGFCWLVDRASRDRLWNVLSRQPLVYLGTISYGLYIFHNLAGIPITWLVEWSGRSWLQTGISGIIALAVMTVALAALSWHCFEKPINDQKDRFPYPRTVPRPVSSLEKGKPSG
jgi:peptidoglycan/LPS O-acetylase OafA/YrhL